MPDILNEKQNVTYREDAVLTNPEEFSKVVQSRRSVRIFDSTPVPESVVREVLDLALLSANSSNLQPWEFYWIRSKDTKAKIVEACFSQLAAKTAQEIIVAVARTKTWAGHAKEMLEVFDQSEQKVPAAAVEYYKKIVPLVYGQGPCGLIGFVKKIMFWFIGWSRPVPREPSSLSDMRAWAIKTTALACQTIMLGFRAHGFDTCPMEGLDSKRVRKILKTPSDANIVMAISVGKRAEDGVYAPRLRFEKSRFFKEI
jgi:nitroreductase